MDRSKRGTIGPCLRKLRFYLSVSRRSPIEGFRFIPRLASELPLPASGVNRQQLKVTTNHRSGGSRRAGGRALKPRNSGKFPGEDFFATKRPAHAGSTDRKAPVSPDRAPLHRHTGR